MGDDKRREIARCYETVQIQGQRALGRFFFVGFFQSAIQTLVQLILLSLSTYQANGEIDYAFLVGVVLNLIQYFMNIRALIELWTKLGNFVFRDIPEHDEVLGEVGPDPTAEEPSEVLDEIRIRRSRIITGFYFGGCFTFFYGIFFVYLVVYLTMFFWCPSHVWNTAWNLFDGCYVDTEGPITI